MIFKINSHFALESVNSGEFNKISYLTKSIFGARFSIIQLPSLVVAAASANVARNQCSHIMLLCLCNFETVFTI